MRVLNVLARARHGSFKLSSVSCWTRVAPIGQCCCSASIGRDVFMLPCPASASVARPAGAIDLGCAMRPSLAHCVATSEQAPFGTMRSAFLSNRRLRSSPTTRRTPTAVRRLRPIGAWHSARRPSGRCGCRNRHHRKAAVLCTTGRSRRIFPGRSFAIPRVAPTIRPIDMIQPCPKRRPQQQGAASHARLLHHALFHTDKVSASCLVEERRPGDDRELDHRRILSASASPCCRSL